MRRLSVLLILLCIAIPIQSSVGQEKPESSRGHFDGPAELPREYVKSALSDTPAPGNKILVKTSSEFTSALNKAACGDTIQLQAGATFVGSFKIPAKSCDDGHWIIIRTSAADRELPAEGVRITPCYAGVSTLPARPKYACPTPKNVMAKVVFNDHGSGPFAFQSGANHYRLIGLEITRDAPGAVTYNLVTNGGTDHIVFDRMWLHGTAQDETTRGIALGGSRYFAVVDSYFSDFHCVAVTGACGDSQAIAGGLGSEPMGPYKIVNNFLEASGENIIFGGGQADKVPADIEIRHNHMFKPLNWAPGSEGFVGGKSGRPFIVKNLFELKNGERVLFEGNILENVWGGFSQAGFAILLTPKNPGNCNVCTVRDITIRYSKITHAGAAMQIANGLSDPGFAAREGSHYSIHDLVFDDMAYKNCPGCNRDFFQLGSTPQAPSTFWLHDVSIRHVTVATDRARAAWVISGPVGQQNMVFQDNIVDGGQYGHVNSGGGAVQCYFQQEVMKGILDRCWASYKFDHNVIMNAVPSHRWPSENWPTGGNGSVGFVSWNGGVDGDYHLSPKSRFKKKASDGKDPGADIDAVNQATKGAE